MNEQTGIPLPSEVILLIAEHLQDPLDLHRSSLVNKGWRAAMSNSSSWERAYWRYYRPISPHDNSDAITARRNELRRRGMIAWLQSTVSSGPTSTTGGSDSSAAAPSANQSQSLHISPQPLQLPAFLASMEVSQKRNSINFYEQFTERMNKDHRLLRELMDHVCLKRNRVDDLWRINWKYGNVSPRELLYSLCATQRAAAQEAPCDLLRANFDFTAYTIDAYDVHEMAAQGRRRPHPGKFLAIRHAAEELLGHMRRREAITNTAGLAQQERGRMGFNAQTVRTDCAELESRLVAFAHFGFADSGQLIEYLDLLALFVWAEIQANVRLGADHTGLPPGTAARQFAERVVRVLDSLGFGLTAHHSDVNNSFIDVCCLCPPQRQTSAFMLASITCFVLRRLGLAAVPLRSPLSSASCFVFEAIQQGDADDHRLPHFYLLTLEGQIVSEPDEVRRFYSGLDPPVNPRRYMMPEPMGALVAAQATRLAQHIDVNASFLRIYEDARSQVGAGFRRIVTRVPRHVEIRGSHGRIIGHAEWLNGRGEEESSQLSAMRSYLKGYYFNPPRPLVSPLLPSMLAMIPPMHANAPRRPSPRDQVAKYAIRALCGTTDEVEATEPGASIVSVLREATRDGRYLLDVLGLSMPDSLALAQCQYDLLTADKMTSDGVGGWGGAPDVKSGRAQWTSEEKRRLDPVFFSSVKHRVGTVFQLAQSERTAVVVGWDTRRRADKDLRQGIVHIQYTGSSRQPFYHAIDDKGRYCYVAQSEVKPIRVRQGSTPNQTVELPQNVIKLLGVTHLGHCFSTLRIEPRTSVSSHSARGQTDAETGGEGQVMLVMNAWMKEAWPFDARG